MLDKQTAILIDIKRLNIKSHIFILGVKINLFSSHSSPSPHSPPSQAYTRQLKTSSYTVNEKSEIQLLKVKTVSLFNDAPFTAADVKI